MLDGVVGDRRPPRRIAFAHGRPRPLAALHPALAARYAGVVAAVAPVVESRLSASALANRVASSSIDPPSIRLVPWRVERLAFAGRLRRLAAEHACLVFCDVADCYGSIGPAAVHRALVRLGCDLAQAREVRALLRSLGGRGLPVGPDPSAVLANAVLGAVDESLARAGVPFARWVDDVVVAVEDRPAAHRALDLVTSALARDGLRLNPTKTRIVLDPGLDRMPALSGPGRRPALG